MNEFAHPVGKVDETIKIVKSLRHRHVRHAKNCFWLEGVRNFIQACDAGYDFETIVISPVLLRSRLAEMLARKLRAKGIAQVRVLPEAFRSISTTDRASGIGAITKQRWLPLKHANPNNGICWLVIEQIRSPGNLGTILRTAEACGVGGVMFIGPESDPFDPTVLRGSMGGVFHVPLVRTTYASFFAWAQRHDVQLVGLAPEAKRLWTKLPASHNIALVLGEERGGLSPPLRAACQTMVCLPMTGRADSLNVSVATGIVLYELVRRQTSLVMDSQFS
jgi:TrmH family RNA methyltransferase